MAIKPFHDVSGDNSSPTVDLESLINDALGCFCREQFCHRRFESGIRVISVVRRGSLIDEKARGFQFGDHFGEIELNALELGDSASELPRARE
ncbi:MAG TPA: hypothetical protein VFY96_08030 [Candidatus Binatia bacterium]|nr:hypothetical protein [Candidatus Binatia bacterium]